MIALKSSQHRKIAYSCFVDAKEKFEKETLRWVWSLIAKLEVDPEDIYVTCDSNVNRNFVAEIQSQPGINLFFEERFTSVSPPANKWLQTKNLPSSEEGYTHVVISDCDKVFLSFNPSWCDDSIRACKFVPRPTFAVFEDLFKKYFNEAPRFILDRPDPNSSINDPRNYVNNHNGGLILVPLFRLEKITNEWKKWIDELMLCPELLRENLRNLDQVAFALAMHSLGSDINFLPQSLDLGPNIAVLSEHFLKVGSGQLILHVHGSDDEEGRIRCGDKAPDVFLQLVETINAEYLDWKSALIPVARPDEENPLRKAG